MTGIDQEWTLFCPHCSYNLRGLQENRCPECGIEFDPKALRGKLLWTIPPITLRTVAIGIVWPAVALWVAAGVAGIASQYRFGILKGILLAADFLVIAAILLFQPGNAFRMAERIALTWPRLQGCSLWGPRGRWSVLGLGLGIYVLELVVTAAPMLLFLAYLV